MATLVTFPAHPDDESIATGGVMAKASDDGHRVVLVVATKGEHGEVDEGILAPGEPLWPRRVQETLACAEILGVAGVEFLGYVDSGMMGTPENDLPGSFRKADVEEAAAGLAAILTEEKADVLTVYDENGNYGHPDHMSEIGVPDERITTTVDVGPWSAGKRAAMAAYASQIAETSLFLSMGPEMCEGAFGPEWFVGGDAPPGLVETDLFDGLS